MKKFIKQVVIFSSLLLIIFGGAFLVSRTLVSRKMDYSLPKNIDKIIIGHSHPEVSYNDSLISNFKNCASSGCAYFYNYYLLKELVEHNPQVQTVFVEFTNNQLDTIMSEWTWGDNYLPFKMQELEQSIDANGKKLLFAKNPGGALKGYINAIRQNMLVLVKRNYSYQHNRFGFNYLVRDKLNEDFKKQKLDTLDKNKAAEISETNLQYLDKIVKYCNEKKLQLFFVRSPLHGKYIPKPTDEIYHNILTSRYKNIELLDFKNFALKDEEFADLEHLNHKGAKRFSNWFNELLEKGLLQANNKKEFVEQHMLTNNI